MTERFAAMPQIVSVTHGDAAVLLNPASGEYYTLTRTGIFIWERLCRGVTLSELSYALAEAFDVDPVTAQADAKRFIDSLHERRLVAPVAL